MVHKYFSEDGNDYTSHKPDKKGTKLTDKKKIPRKNLENENKERVYKKKRKRLIIRNLSFKVEEEELKNVFSKFGNVLDVKIPLKEDGKKRGFAFVEFDNTQSLIKAVKSMNLKEIEGRKVAVDFALDKSKYEQKLNRHKEETENLKKEEEDLCSVKSEDDDDLCSVKSEEVSYEDDEVEIKNVKKSGFKKKEDEGDKRVKDFMKEFDSGIEAGSQNESEAEPSGDEFERKGAESDDEASMDEEDDVHMDEDDDTQTDEDDDDSESDEDEKVEIVKVKKEGEVKKEKGEDSKSSWTKPKFERKRTDDVVEGKTVFIQNLAFITDQESLQETVEEFGDIVYCLICVDKITNHSKGTAFVKFKEKESADKLILESMDDPGIILDGRKLTCQLALSRDNVPVRQPKVKKDKRNLYLLPESVIDPNSEEAQDMSAGDLAKRAKLDALKKSKLKNSLFFVSDTRLAVHNIPFNYSDRRLHKLFKNAGGKGAFVTEARIMRELNQTDDKGFALSKGFGFVNFKEHEHALRALKELNNNPTAFSAQRRPIVEFSIESKMALMAKERRREKSMMMHKARKEQQLNNGTSRPNQMSRPNQLRRPFQKETTGRPHQNSSEKKIKKGKWARIREEAKQKKMSKKQKVQTSRNDVSNLISKYKTQLMSKMDLS